MNTSIQPEALDSHLGDGSFTGAGADVDAVHALDVRRQKGSCEYNNGSN